MFDFPVFITLLVTLFGFYFTLYFNFKKEIDDLEFDTIKNPKTTKQKIYNRKKKIHCLNIITILILIVVIVLYTYPFLTDIFSNFDSTILTDIAKYISKIFPFKKGFFADANFKFSFITGLVLSIIIEFIIFIMIDEIIVPCFFFEHFLQIILLIISAILLIWANNYISLFLSYCIVHCFPFLSIVLNLLSYIIIIIVISIIYSIISSRKSKSAPTKENKS